MLLLKKVITLILAFLCLTIIGKSQVKNVDNFKLGNDSITVFFYDPLVNLIKLDKNFQAKSDEERSDVLTKYLHENPLYLFRLVNGQTKEIRFLCIRGNPEKVNTKMFYKVEVIKNVSADFNPNEVNYSDKIVDVINYVNCGGTLFENMSLFDDEQNKKYIGNGVQLYGYSRRVQPYLEVKTSIIYIIEQLLDKK